MSALQVAADLRAATEEGDVKNKEKQKQASGSEPSEPSPQPSQSAVPATAGYRVRVRSGGKTERVRKYHDETGKLVTVSVEVDTPHTSPREQVKDTKRKPVLPSFYQFGSSAIADFVTVRDICSNQLRKNLDVDLDKLNAYSLYVLGCTAAEVLKQRVIASKGNDRDAVEYLATLAAHCVARLNEELASEQPEMFRPIARGRRTWPLLVSPHPDGNKVNANLLDKLEVGAGLALNMSRRAKWSLTRTATQCAMMMANTVHANWRLMKLIEDARRLQEQQGELAVENANVEPPAWAKRCGSLAPLNEDPKAWFAIGWQALMEQTGDHPEKIPFLRRIGEYRARHSEYQEQQKKVTAAVREANIRDGIKTQLWRAFQNMVRKKKQHVSPS